MARHGVHDRTPVTPGRVDDALPPALYAALGDVRSVALLGADDQPLILSSIETIDARIDRSDQSWREWENNLDSQNAWSVMSPGRSSALRPSASISCAIFLAASSSAR